MSLLHPDWLSGACDARWLVAVSGGRDSVALLDACAQVQNLTKSNKLVVCHVNHQLRGEESDADEQFVRNLAKHYGLPISVHHVDVATIAEKEKKSIERAAREARHAAFFEACAKYGCDGVLLGHHADDQAETVLYHLLRGSAGLKGIQMEADLSRLGLKLVRPMLNVRRAGIDRYIAEQGLTYREDSSNKDSFAVRNRIRHEVMPLLKDVLKRDVSGSILKALESARETEDVLAGMVDYASMLDPQGRLHLPSVAELPEYLKKRVLHQYLSENAVKNLSQELVVSCLTLFDMNMPAKINLPGGCFLRRKEQRIFVSE